MSVDYLVTQAVQRGFPQLGADLRIAAQAFDRVESSRDRFASNLIGMGTAVTIGAALMGRLSSSTRDVYLEADTAKMKLVDMLNVRGQGGHFDILKKDLSDLSLNSGVAMPELENTGAHLLSFGITARQVQGIMGGIIGQARTMDQSTMSVADQLGRSFGSLNVGALTRTGVILSQAEKDQIKALRDAHDPKKFAEGQAVLYEAVVRSYQKYAVAPDKGISQAALAQNRFNEELRRTQELIGGGSADAQTNLNKMGGAALHVAQQHPGLMKEIGEVSTYGALAGKIAGPLLVGAGALIHMKRQADFLKTAKESLKFAVDSEARSEVAKTGIAQTEAAALGGVEEAATKVGGRYRMLETEAGPVLQKIGGVGTAAEESAVKLGLLARAKGLLGTPIQDGLTKLGGADITLGGGLTSVGLGVGAGVGARNDMKGLGYGEAGSDAYGIATGVGAAAIALFVPGGAVAVALIEGARLMMKTVSDITERDAYGATKDADGNTIDDPARMKGSKANRSAEAFRRADEIQKAADRINPNFDIRGYEPAQDEKDKLTREAEGWRRVGGALGLQSRKDKIHDAWNATFNDPKTQHEARKLSNENYAAFQKQQGINPATVGHVTNLRNGESKVNVEIRIPERASDRSHRRLRTNTLTAAPNFAA